MLVLAVWTFVSMHLKNDLGLLSNLCPDIQSDSIHWKRPCYRLDNDEVRKQTYRLAMIDLNIVGQPSRFHVQTSGRITLVSHQSLLVPGLADLDRHSRIVGRKIGIYAL
jgi:hypothetical protein